ncbi:MAG TPA: HTH domain-containing protein [Eudoraea sp.]|nr:HTH domain-containing protein [Eudoraea sp.]
MNSIKNLERLQQIHFLIENESTGSPKELASRLDISERSIYLLMEQLKDFNAHISYDRSRKTYYYKNEFKLQVQVSVSVSNNDEVTEVFGGSYFVKSKTS